MNLLFYTYSYTSYNPKSLKEKQNKKISGGVSGGLECQGTRTTAQISFDVPQAHLERQNIASHCHLSLLAGLSLLSIKTLAG